MRIDVVDQTGSEERLHRILYFIKYLRAMLLNSALVIVAIALFAGAGIEGVYFLADDAIAALKAQMATLEAAGNPLGRAFVPAIGAFTVVSIALLFLWIYVAITRVWRRSLKVQAAILAGSALFMPFWALPNVQFALTDLHPGFTALAAGAYALMFLLVMDIAVGLWGVSKSPDASSFVATLDPKLNRGLWSYLNKLLDLPRTPWRGWHNVAAYLIALGGMFLLIVSLMYITSFGAADNKLAYLIASCTADKIADCHALSASWALQIPVWLVVSLAGLQAGGLLQSAARWLGGLSVPEALAASGGRFVLYLRPFDTDDDILPKPKLPLMSRLIAFRPFPARVEEELFDVADGYLPLIAIGRPGEQGQDSGGLAHRAYLDDAEWQGYVADKIKRADSIVMLLKDTDGVRWEIGKVLGDSVEEKTLFLFDPVARDPAQWDRLAPKMIAPFVAGGYLPKGFAFNGRPLGFYFRDGGVVEIENANWSATSYRTAFSEFLAERAG
jgi:hypothetical protein